MMVTQLEIFTMEKHIPQWLADYFFKANAGSYVYKQDFYTRVKPNVLKRFGVFDGYDLQTIYRSCRSCEGTGLYKNYYYEGGFRHLLKKEHCWSCNGTGVYCTRRISLERYVLNGVIYHLPVNYDKYNMPVKNEFNGLVVHEAVDADEAYRAFLVLAWKYDKGFFYSRAKEFAEAKVEWMSGFIQSLFRKDNTIDDLPF